MRGPRHFPHDCGMNSVFRQGSRRIRQSVFMMKRIISTGAVSVALAAATLLAPSALAAPDRAEGKRQVTTQQLSNGYDRRGNRSFEQRGHRQGQDQGRFDSWHRNDKYNRYDRWDWNDHNSRRDRSFGQSRRQAVRQCAQALDARTDRFYPGRFGDADFLRRPRVYQAGRAGRALVVQGPVRVTNRFDSKVVPASCTIRHGRVVNMDFDPVIRGHRGRGHGNRNRGRTGFSVSIGF